MAPDRRPSSRATPYFAHRATIRTPGSRYDPSYRQFDVEGYRVYRGRTDTPNTLQLVAQFDYAGTPMFDFRGTINPSGTCGRRNSASSRVCRSRSDHATGRAGRFTDSVAVELTGEIIQVSPAGAWRSLTAPCDHNGPDAVDTLVTGGDTGFPALATPACRSRFTDDGSGLLSAPRNNVRYFYSVTAFDVNSFASGPSSLESQRSARR